MTPLAAAGISANADRLHYPASAMAGDYLRAAAGLAPTLLILSTVSVGEVAAVVLAGFAAIFGTFAVRTALRHATSIELDGGELRAAGLRTVALAWSELDRMKLAFYSTRRDRKSGWMQLELGAGRLRVSVDSRLDGFERVVQHAVAAAGDRNLELSPATAANLQALGIRIPETTLPR